MPNSITDTVIDHLTGHIDSIADKVDSIVDRVNGVLRGSEQDSHLLSLPWIMFQSWRNVLFASWPIPVDKMRPLVPPSLEIDTFDGQAWVSILPFGVADVHWRDLPPIPDNANYLELNLRTYVKDQDSSGVYFLSLDCTTEMAVLVARHLFEVPFFDASISCAQQNGSFYFQSHRNEQTPPAADFVGSYTPTGVASELTPGSLEAFLAERYSLFVQDRNGQLHSCSIRHAPWMTQSVVGAEFEVSTIAAAMGVDLPNTPPHLFFAPQTDTLIWPLERVSA